MSNAFKLVVEIFFLQGPGIEVQERLGMQKYAVLVHMWSR